MYKYCYWKWVNLGVYPNRRVIWLRTGSSRCGATAVDLRAAFAVEVLDRRLAGQRVQARPSGRGGRGGSAHGARAPRGCGRPRTRRASASARGPRPRRGRRPRTAPRAPVGARSTGAARKSRSDRIASSTLSNACARARRAGRHRRRAIRPARCRRGVRTSAPRSGRAATPTARSPTSRRTCRRSRSRGR